VIPVAQVKVSLVEGAEEDARFAIVEVDGLSGHDCFSPVNLTD
jgi:hypothetical protein